METFSKYVVAPSSTGGKFWEVLVEGAEMSIRYGKLGQQKAWTTTTHASHETAVREATKKLNSKLRKGYAEAEAPSATVDADGPLAEMPLTAVLYFRAFDRWPGGNADMFTIKATLRYEPGTSPTLRARVYHNWDGEHWVYPEVAVKLPLDQTVPGFLQAAQSMVDAGQSDVALEVVENRRDTDAYDTEWSSLEFTLTPRGADNPVLHFVQKAVAPKDDPKLPDPVSAAFLDSVLAMTGLTRVQQYSDQECPFSRAFKSSGQSKGYQDGPVPLFL